ncbi:MAG TPA: CBS domain-containing protein [Synergistaceae bacterium]|nr:CBS domain-containing protein [Synergistaceae bacterium]HPJ25913.1 CBS domain-containing protein [Synergistaceae bacterium]HPQ36085.1 CBS domain-containing protein [Synergistaceae bacterium]
MTTNASKLMVRDLTAVSPEDRILDAVRVLYSHRLPGVPVIDDDWRLVGYLAQSDILEAAVPTFLEVLSQTSFLDDSEGNLLQRLQLLGRHKVQDYMRGEPLVMVDPYASLMTVADLMLRKGVERLPVVEEGRFLGIIDRASFCEFMMEDEEAYARINA